MNDPKVLTDYYARRHTQQYRSNFLLLAEQFIAKKDFKKAIFLLDKSLELMPLENVLDFGEVNQCDPFTSLKINSSHLNYSYQGEEANAKCSGSLHEYVQLYLLAGNKKKATDLGLKLMANYFSNREQIVRINNIMSGKRPITEFHRVPFLVHFYFLFS
jgi:hypothetical protein